jgi:hypothetical protein
MESVLCGRSAVLGRLAETGDYKREDKSGKIGGKCERQVTDVGKSYREISCAMMRNGADWAIIVMVLTVVVVMEGDQQDRAQHDHCHCEGNDMPKLFSG